VYNEQENLIIASRINWKPTHSSLADHLIPEMVDEIPMGTGILFTLNLELAIVSTPQCYGAIAP